MCRLATALVRYLMFATNLLFALAGLAILGVGVAMHLRVSSITSLVDSYFNVAPALAITFGAIVFVIAFFGCCGAIRESNCMLVFYAVLLILLMIVKIVFASLLLANKTSIDSSAQSWLSDNYAQYSTSTEAQASIDGIQSTFRCCGTTGPNSFNIALPSSCCEESVTACNVANAFSDGCLNSVSEYLDVYVVTLAILLLLVAAVEFVAVVFGLCLANDARNKDRRY